MVSQDPFFLQAWLEDPLNLLHPAYRSSSASSTRDSFEHPPNFFILDSRSIISFERDMSGNAWAQRKELSAHSRQSSTHNAMAVAEGGEELSPRPTPPPKSPSKTTTMPATEPVVVVPKHRIIPATPLAYHTHRRQQTNPGRSFTTPVTFPREEPVESKSSKVVRAP